MIISYIIKQKVLGIKDEEKSLFYSLFSVILTAIVLVTVL